MSYSSFFKDTKNTEEMIWKVLLAMQTQAANIAPVDTGNLRNAITISTNRKSKRFGPVITDKAEHVGGFGAPTQDNVGWIGVALTYGPAVEFGRPDIPNYPAQPYLRPTADWMRKKLGMISANELKARLALYAVRHPYLLVSALNGSVTITERK